LIKVAVNGYGTIGKRVAEAISLQGDMRLVGISKTKPNYEAIYAQRIGMRLYVPETSLREFEEAGIEPAGTVEDMIREAEVVVDATPGGIGASYKPLYASLGRRAVFQGGEKAQIADVSFSSLCNYGEAVGRDYVRVTSCNTTSILRVLCTLNRISRISKVRVVIVRRAADPKEMGRGPINSLVPDPVEIPSHHTADVKSVIKGLDVVTMAVIAPTTLMHFHLLDLHFFTSTSKRDVIEVLMGTPRILLVRGGSGVKSTAEILEVMRDVGRRRGDLYEVAVFEDSINVRGEEVFLTYAVHQEAVVIPENVDAVRAVSGYGDAKGSILATDSSLGVRKGYLI